MRTYHSKRFYGIDADCRAVEILAVATIERRRTCADPNTDGPAVLVEVALSWDPSDLRVRYDRDKAVIRDADEWKYFPLGPLGDPVSFIITGPNPLAASTWETELKPRQFDPAEP